MLLNVTYMGVESTANERRDFMLYLHSGLSAVGHDVILSHNQVFKDRLNLIIGSHNLVKGSPPTGGEVIGVPCLAGVPYAVIQTETISDNSLNFRKDKCHFPSFVNLLSKAEFIWDVIPSNISSYPLIFYSNLPFLDHIPKPFPKASFLRWGYTPTLCEIPRLKPEIDVYFFGVLSPYRKEMLSAISASGLRVVAHEGIPYYARNTYIARSKVCVNLIQKPEMTHVNNFRLCYLANNAIPVVAELPEGELHDPAGYMELAYVATRGDLVETLREVCGGTRLELGGLGHRSYERLKEHCAETIFEELLPL